MSGSKKPLLVVLDLNGTLLDRLTHGDRVKLARENPLCPPLPDLVINGKKIYYRPYLDAFLNGLFERAEVATWTSAMPKNAKPMVDNLFPKQLRDKLQFNWTRERCEIMGSARDHLSIKDLSAIWRDAEASKNGRWTAKNTIIIDDSTDKGARNPKNAVHLVPFTVTEPEMLDCDVDPTLLGVLNYLQHMTDWLAEGGEKDVRDFVGSKPLYVAQSSSESLASSSSSSSSSESSSSDSSSDSSSSSSSSDSEPAQTLLSLAPKYLPTTSQMSSAELQYHKHRRDSAGFTRHWLQQAGTSNLPGEDTGQWDKSHKQKDLKKFKPAGSELRGREERGRDERARSHERRSEMDMDWRRGYSTYQGNGHHGTYHQQQYNQPQYQQRYHPQQSNYNHHPQQSHQQPQRYQQGPWLVTERPYEPDSFQQHHSQSGNHPRGQSQPKRGQAKRGGGSHPKHNTQSHSSFRKKSQSRERSNGDGQGNGYSGGHRGNGHGQGQIEYRNGGEAQGRDRGYRDGRIQIEDTVSGFR